VAPSARKGEMGEDALQVVGRMLSEDDHSVETSKLGDWCLCMLDSEPKKTTMEEAVMHEEHQTQELGEHMHTARLESSRGWMAPIWRS